MNPDLQAKLVTYLDGLEKGAAKVGEFAEREIPETIREWLLWLAIERFTYAAAFLVAGIVAVSVVRWAWRNAPKWESEFIAAEKRRYPALFADREPDWFPIHIPVSVLGCGIAVIMLGLFIQNALGGVKVIVAPRVVIVEKVAELTLKNQK